MSRIGELGSPAATIPTPHTERSVKPSAVAASEGPSPFARILHGLGGQLERGEHTMARVTHARGGTEMASQDLLALQADVYRYSEAVDLSAKLVDRASNGVKTVIQGQ